jgi:hypothetical protein
MNSHVSHTQIDPMGEKHMMRLSYHGAWFKESSHLASC